VQKESAAAINWSYRHPADVQLRRKRAREAAKHSAAYGEKKKRGEVGFSGGSGSGDADDGRRENRSGRSGVHSGDDVGGCRGNRRGCGRETNHVRVHKAAGAR